MAMEMGLGHLLIKAQANWICGHPMTIPEPKILKSPNTPKPTTFNPDPDSVRSCKYRHEWCSTLFRLSDARSSFKSRPGQK